MGVYMVEIVTYGVVVAENAQEAKQKATQFKNEIFRDDGDPEITVQLKIKNEKELTNKWSGDCLPYGGDGNTSIRNLLTLNNRLEELHNLKIQASKLNEDSKKENVAIENPNGGYIMVVRDI